MQSEEQTSLKSRDTLWNLKLIIVVSTPGPDISSFRRASSKIGDSRSVGCFEIGIIERFDFGRSEGELGPRRKGVA